MNNEGLNALIAFFCVYFDIHYSLIGVHNSINEGSAALWRGHGEPPLLWRERESCAWVLDKKWTNGMGNPKRMQYVRQDALPG
jgi:hypothetical protein